MKQTIGSLIGSSRVGAGKKQGAAGRARAPLVLSLILASMGSDPVLGQTPPADPAAAAPTEAVRPVGADGVWFEVGVDCPYCLTLDKQGLQLAQVAALIKYSDRIELQVEQKLGKSVNRTQGTETITRSLRVLPQTRRQQLILIQYAEGDGDRASDLFARIWILTPMADNMLLYGRRLQVSAYTDEAFEPRGRGYRAKEKFLPPERLQVILEDVRVSSLTETRKTYQAGEQVRLSLDGAVAFVRETIKETDVASAREEATRVATERTGREALFRTLVQQGDQAYKEEDYDKALNQYKAASALLPEQALVHSDLGAVYQVQNKLPEAEASYRLALELDGSELDTLFNLGMVLEQSARLQEALEVYKQVQEKRPQDSEARDKVAKLSLRLRRQ